MIGFGAIFLALIATCIAAFYYGNSHMEVVTRRTIKQEAGHKGEIWYAIATGLIGIAAAYLSYIILSDQYQYAYVYSYSSRDLDLTYKLSAFWAGQEGSFLLWVVFHGMFGQMLLRRKDTPPGVMSIYNLLQALLLIIILAKSPFVMLSELPTDGNGLNPLLQDPWMIIHPPVVFLGYAGLAVPFAYALEGLLSRRHSYWLVPALSWTLFSWATLGAGIFIGGFWAYKVLGWGGYWAWDPVENSSLVPWLVAGALLHLLLLARIRPSGVKLAYIASIFSFVLVLYGTFLTRSGVLSDFSTHSFADEGAGGLLAGFVLLITIAANSILILRWGDMPKGELYPAINSREFILACTGLVFAVFAVLVFIGMSTPVFTALLGQPQNVNMAFYNSTSLPLAVAMALLLTIGPVLKWGTVGFKARKYWGAILCGHVGMIVAAKYGIYHPLIVTVIFFSLASLAMNIYGARRQLITWPAGLTHIGVALLLIGIMVSSAGSQSQMVSFEPEQSQQVFGQKLTYLGIEKMPYNNGFYQNFSLEGDNKYLLQPLTKLNKEGNPAAREPGIYRGLLADLYIAPVMKRESAGGKEFVMHKGDQTVQEGIQFKFIRVGMNSGKANNEDVRIQALLEVIIDGKTTEISPEMAFRNGRAIVMPLTVFEHYEVVLNGVNPGEGAISLAVRNMAIKSMSEHIDVEVSHKPLINLIWLGTVLITLGTFWAGYKRLQVSEQITTGNEKK